MFFVSCGVAPVSEEQKNLAKNELLDKINQKEIVQNKNIKIQHSPTVETKNKFQKKLVEQKNISKIKLDKNTIDVAPGSVKNQKVDGQPKLGSFLQIRGELEDLKGEFLKDISRKFRISLLGVEMGRMEIKGKSISDDVYQFFGKLQNNSIYKYLYAINDLLVTQVDKKTLNPLLVNLEKNENGVSSISVEKISDGKILFFENTIKKGKKSSKERVLEYAGHYFDPLMFLRYIEIVDVEKIKDSKIPVIFRGRFYDLKPYRIENITKGVGRKKVQLQKIYFETFKDNKIKKDQKIILQKYSGEKSKIFSIEGRMKVGVLYGELFD